MEYDYGCALLNPALNEQGRPWWLADQVKGKIATGAERGQLLRTPDGNKVGPQRVWPF